MDAISNYLAYALVVAGTLLLMKFFFGPRKVENPGRKIRSDIYRWNDNSAHRDLS